MSTVLRCLMILASIVLIGACGRDNPDDYPVSHWLEDGEDCTRASAAAIIKSGLPFPNYGTEPVVNKKTGKTEQRVRTVDMWLGDVRFVIPAEVMSSNAGYPRTHPRHNQRLAGTMPHFYPKGPPAPVMDGMSAMVDVRFTCSMNPQYSRWGKGFRSREEGMAAIKAEYEKRLRDNPTGPGTVSVNRRNDLGMMEVLLDRGREAHGSRWWSAAYWPMSRDLIASDGTVSAIVCDQVRHDPVEKRYGGVGWRCSSRMSITRNAEVSIDIYVPHLKEMPAVFDQVKSLLLSAKQDSE